jgi:hypothetical protein
MWRFLYIWIDFDSLTKCLPVLKSQKLVQDITLDTVPEHKWKIPNPNLNWLLGLYLNGRKTTMSTDSRTLLTTQQHNLHFLRLWGSLFFFNLALIFFGSLALIWMSRCQDCSVHNRFSLGCNYSRTSIYILNLSKMVVLIAKST